MSKSKIWLIEEHADIAAQGEASLKRLGYECARTCPTVAEARAQFEQARPDLVLLTFAPQTTRAAIQAGEALRAEFHLPVIYLTSENDSTDLQQTQLRPRFDFLTSPFGDHELYFAVETALLGNANQPAQVSSIEDFFRQSLIFAPNAFIVVDEHSLIRFANAEAEKLLGFTHEKLLGADFEILIPERFRAKHIQHNKDYFSEPKKRALGLGLDVFCLRQDGTEFPVEIGLDPVTLEGQTFVLVSILDISLRKQSEDNLRQADIKYRTLVEQIPAIIYITQLDQHIGVTYISPRIEALGFTQEEWVADPQFWFRQLHPADQGRILAEIEEDKQAGEPFHSEYRLLTRDGQVRWFLDEAMNVLDGAGNPLYRQGFMLDITERKTAEESLASRQRYLAALNDMTHVILLARDLDSTLQTLAFNMKKLIDADDCYITRWDEEKQLVIPTVSTATLEKPYADYKPDLGETNLTTSVIRAGHILVIEDVFNSPYIDVEIAKQFPVRSSLGVPLIVGQHKLGIAIIAFNTPHHFTQEEIERAEQAGAQVALALWTFQQGVEIQQRLKESRTLAEIGRALSEGERIGTGEVSQLIVDATRDLIPHAEKSVIHLLEIDEQTLFAWAVSGYEEETKEVRGVKMRLGEGVAGSVIREGITINIGDVTTDAHFIRGDTLPAYRSLLVAPVQSGDRQIGTISIQSAQKNAFSAKDAELLNALGIQAAVAIENTRLFETTQQSLKEVNALYLISRELAASLDTDQLIRDMVGMIQRMFSYYHVQFYLLDQESRKLVVKHGSGYIGKELVQKGHFLPAGEGIVGHVAETSQPFFTNNVEAVVFFKRNPLLPETQSEIAVPIIVDKQVAGVLDIQNTPQHRFTEGDFQLMITVADQLAVALQRASLYNNLQTALQQEQTVRSQLIQSERLALVGRLLASVSHELNNPLQAIQNALFLLKEETNLSTQAKQDLDVILSEAERMAALIERLRGAYRPVRIRDFHPVDLNGLIEDVHTLITTHMRHKEIIFEFLPDENLPPISGIQDQIRQVALNLFLNAIEIMKPGGRLTVQTRSLPHAGEVLLTVKDTGPGIDSQILPNIFDPFITSKHTGTGLGLTITHDIIEQHHGRITADNNPEGGAIFNVWLPIH